MNAVESTLRRVAKDLTGLRQRWALVGGFAVSARSEPRFTRDVDIVVAVANDDAAESLVRQLLTQQYHLLASVEQDAARRLAAVRLGATADTAANVVVDLLFASCGIEPEIAEAAEEIEILPDLVAPVATTAHLIAMKLLARDDDRRPQDRSDLRALVDAASPQDIQDARKAIELITLRGLGKMACGPGSEFQNWAQHLSGLPTGALGVVGGGDEHRRLVERANEHLGQRPHRLTSQLAGPDRLGDQLFGHAWLEVSGDPEVRQLILLDAPVAITFNT